MIDKAKSITHQHLLSVLNTELESYSEERILRIPDVGCGDGQLINYLVKNFGDLNPAIEFEIYGFDVNDHGVQSEGYFKNTIELLSEHFPGISWDKRLHVISAKELWPYPDDVSSVIISNQVVEHVRDNNLFFFEINRALHRGGYSIHLFLSKHYLYEGYRHLPLVHRILNHYFLFSYIKHLSRLGLEPKYKYNHNRMSLVDWLAILFLVYVSSTTLVLRKNENCARK